MWVNKSNFNSPVVLIKSFIYCTLYGEKQIIYDINQNKMKSVKYKIIGIEMPNLPCMTFDEYHHFLPR